MQSLLLSVHIEDHFVIFSVQADNFSQNSKNKKQELFVKRHLEFYVFIS